MSESEFEEVFEENSPEIVDIDPPNTELDEFENRILLTSKEPENIEYSIEKDSELPDKPKKRPAKKDHLINSILKFKGHLPELVPTKNKLKKTKVAALEKKLARLIATASGLSLKPEHADPISEPAFASAPAPVSSGPVLASAKGGAQTLYMATTGMVSVLENVSVQTEDYTGCRLEGWSDDLKKDKEQLMMILEGVYSENAEIVSTYMSASSVLGLYLLTSGAGHLKMKAPTLSEE